VLVAEKTAIESMEKPALIEGSRAAVMFHHVGGIMNTHVETVESSKKFSEATRLMDEKDTGYLVVLENREPIGIITKKDVYRRVIANDLDTEKLTAGQIMSKPLITLSPNGSIEDAAKLMITHNISKVPIIEGSTIVGIVTETELIKTLWNLLFLLP